MAQTALPRAEKKRKMTRLEKKNTLIAYSFLAPNFIGFLIFTMIPVVFSILLAFLNWNGGGFDKISWAGLDNFATIFKVSGADNFGDAVSRFFAKTDLGISLRNTLYYTIATVPLTIACALGLALILNRPMKGGNVLRAVYFFPYVASVVAICVCWNFMLMKTGPVNQILNALGFNMTKSWTSDRNLAMWAIILVSVWRGAGYYMVMYLAGLKSVPGELYEAATMDGANAWQKFRKITLPMLTPTTFFVSIMLIISCFKIYDVVAIMTEGGPGRATKMLVTYIYDLSFNQIKYGVASAVAMVLFVIVLGVTVIQFRGEKKWVNYM